ncbi:ankyrin repeat domain-containing protein [Clostridium felsineum]|uniref:ankyrin repeat domain-containing protein n=1 Tax=Clostridium felsineum TaxID=36839 RepID=UPI00214D9B3A|nr:ankyrin repeat domain-containing protein [Clostridium felsineum]MCR3759769.1 ankyrin repeat domain-containing protein [Clostridium felsineum]
MKKNKYKLIIGAVLILVILSLMALTIRIIFFVKMYNYNYGYSQKLISAIKANNENKVKDILNSPGNINSLPIFDNIISRDLINDPPITEACRVGNINIIKMLLEHGASVKAPKHSWNPLPAACSVYNPNRIEIIDLLIKYGADVNERDSDNNTPLLMSIDGGYKDENGKKDIKQEEVMYKAFIDLVEKGADIYAEDFQKRNSLLIASSSDNTLVVKYLINERKFDINKRDDYGKTALMLAIEGGSSETAEFLIKAGANKDIKDNEGKTAYDYAKKYKNQVVMKLLNLK